MTSYLHKVYKQFPDEFWHSMKTNPVEIVQKSYEHWSKCRCDFCQDVTKRIKEILEKNGYCDRMRGESLEDYKKRSIECQKKERLERGWIDCRKQMPEKDTIVTAYTPGYIFEGCWDGISTIDPDWYGTDGYIWKVSYWKPLPNTSEEK
jgi:hypothetical protein